jgi:hypothetical protein
LGEGRTAKAGEREGSERDAFHGNLPFAGLTTSRREYSLDNSAHDPA